MPNPATIGLGIVVVIICILIYLVMMRNAVSNKVSPRGYHHVVGPKRRQ